MSIDLEALKQVAQATTPGPWRVQEANAGDRGHEVADRTGLEQICADLTRDRAAFIAAANPAVVLELIARLEQAEQIRSSGWIVNLASWQRTIARIADPAVRASMMEFLMKLDQAATDFLERDKALREALERAQAAVQRQDELVDLLVSARAIAERQGEDTAWDRFSQRIASFGIGCITAKIFKILPSDTEQEGQ